MIVASNAGPDLGHHLRHGGGVSLLQHRAIFVRHQHARDFGCTHPYNVCMRFEWDSVKAASNAKKHKVTFEVAKTVFYDDFAVQFIDEEHSYAEDRFLLLGMSSDARLLLVCHCERADGDVIRIISARKATETEAQYYRGE